MPDDGALLQIPQDLAFPDIRDLASTLRFVPEQGHIWLAGRRMMLVHARSTGVLRRELINALGMERARAILTRQGYEAGAMDAEAAAKVRSRDQVFEAFSAGPQLHALEGVVRVEPIKFEADVRTGSLYAEYRWHNSVECSVHRELFGPGIVSAGWSQIGYASGYASVFLARPVVYREVECIARGHQACRIIGKPVDDWTDAEPDLKYMRSEQFQAHARQSVDLRRTAPREAGNSVSDTHNLTDCLVGASSEFNHAFEMLRHVADTDAVVLFLGESGVGKERFARALHDLGDRKRKPFVAVNCAAIPEHLVEAELFGVEHGAFTGAVSRPGRFERADGGTLFLDEVGTLTLSAQAKLLRAIQEREIERVGGTSVKKINVRIVAATNANLADEVKSRRFRTDLFYRLNVVPISIPPLRSRCADIPLLMEHFLEIYRTRHRRSIAGFDASTVAAMLSYDWPGNVRELENTVERGVILAGEEGIILPHHAFGANELLSIQSFDLDDRGQIRTHNDNGKLNRELSPIESLLRDGAKLTDIEGALLEEALTRNKGNRSAAARALGLSRAQFNYRMGLRSSS
ncbi:MAG TPA: sigma 54-interacting transcriptional regulator [Sphingobium sp.]|nr:sigma 54-interacting transcriptional regulator [Sphingobium sp.]